MKIFLTGASGFIGRHVTAELEAAGHELLILRWSKDPFPAPGSGESETVEGDLSDAAPWKGKLTAFAPDAAIHLGWGGWPEHGVETSIQNFTQSLGTLKLLREIGCKRVLAAGTCWEYGRTKGKLDESMALLPRDAFAAAKNSLNLFGRAFADEDGNTFIWVRIFYVYGPGQRAASLMPHIIRSIRNGEDPAIRTPHAKHDFVHVKDVSRAICALVTGDAESGVYNIGTGKSTSVARVLELVYKAFGKEPVALAPDDGTGADFWADTEKLAHTLDWTPQRTLEESIPELVRGGEDGA